MPWAEFAEKEYEVAAAIELAAGRGGAVWSSGQVLEELLGYDAATDPGPGHPLWQLLRVPRPAGLRLIDGHWPAGNPRPPQHVLPPNPVTLVLQYKRPEFLFGHRAKQWPLWGQPYFRFTRQRNQQEVLLRLESRLNNAALVRYAAPSFWQRGEYEAACLTGSVLARSGFVSPSSLKGHRVWTYVRPGTSGRANPDGRRRDFEDLRALFEQRSSGRGDLAAGAADVVVRNALRAHLREVAAVASWREPAVREIVKAWGARVRAEVPELNGGQFEGVVAMATISSVLARTGARWFLI